MKQIWVDADACPKIIKEILFKAAIRTKTPLILVANAYIHTPGSPFIRTVRVEKGFDKADNYLVMHAQVIDLVITADVPLAAELVAKGCLVVNPRGTIYTENDIKQKLTLRDMNEQLRSFGEQRGGPAAFTDKDKVIFANIVDRWLSKKAT